MNKIWGGMLAIGIGYGIVQGKVSEISMAILEGAQAGVTMTISMAGILCFWLGLMEIAKECGILHQLQRWISPFLHWLFPQIPISHPVMEYLSLNVISNVFGLGSAATPAGLKTMKMLEELEEKRRKAKVSAVEAGTSSNEMCTFLVLNISSLQLIPVNMIAYRNQFGSSSPTAIVGPGIAATAVSTLAAVIVCKILSQNK